MKKAICEIKFEKIRNEIRYNQINWKREREREGNFDDGDQKQKYNCEAKGEHIFKSKKLERKGKKPYPSVRSRWGKERLGERSITLTG